MHGGLAPLVHFDDRTGHDLQAGILGADLQGLGDLARAILARKGEGQNVIDGGGFLLAHKNRSFRF
ncbi:MAG: hypothetical protein V9H26_25625 [Verrucomicrobiota bacterium]